MFVGLWSVFSMFRLGDVADVTRRLHIFFHKAQSRCLAEVGDPSSHLCWDRHGIAGWTQKNDSYELQI